MHISCVVFLKQIIIIIIEFGGRRQTCWIGTGLIGTDYVHHFRFNNWTWQNLLENPFQICRTPALNWSNQVQLHLHYWSHQICVCLLLLCLNISSSSNSSKNSRSLLTCSLTTCLKVLTVLVCCIHAFTKRPTKSGVGRFKLKWIWSRERESFKMLSLQLIHRRNQSLSYRCCLWEINKFWVDTSWWIFKFVLLFLSKISISWTWILSETKKLWNSFGLHHAWFLSQTWW